MRVLGWIREMSAQICLRTPHWMLCTECLPTKIHILKSNSLRFSSVQSLSRVWLFSTPWIAARQASLSITNSWSSSRLTSIQSVMPSSHLILCRPLLLLPPIPPSIGVFSNESTLRTRWPKYWSFSFSISPSKEIPGLISLRMDWLDLLAVQGISRVFSNTTVQEHQFFSARPSSQSNSHIQKETTLCVLSHFSRVWLCVILWTVAYPPLPMGFSSQE